MGVPENGFEHCGCERRVACSIRLHPASVRCFHFTVLQRRYAELIQRMQSAIPLSFVIVREERDRRDLTGRRESAEEGSAAANILLQLRARAQWQSGNGGGREEEARQRCATAEGARSISSTQSPTQSPIPTSQRTQAQERFGGRLSAAVLAARAKRFVAFDTSSRRDLHRVLRSERSCAVSAQVA